MASLSNPDGLTLRDIFHLVGGNLDATLVVRGPDKNYEPITDIYDLSDFDPRYPAPPMIVFAAAATDYPLEVEWPDDEC